MKKPKYLATRRQLINYASLLALGSFYRPTKASPYSPVSFPDNPFKLGVASGDPSAEGFVLWTRLLVDPYDVASLPADTIAVRWEVSTSETMKNITRSGTTMARLENAHSIHVPVYGLTPNTEYYYRFRCGDEISPTGKVHTLPVLNTNIDDFTFAVASCQDIASGFFAAYRDMAAQNPRLIIHTGDYIYESIYKDGTRRFPVTNATTLADYRNLYTRYRLDKNLQAAHAACAWLSLWDDHEVENDWGGDYSESVADQSTFLARKIAAFKAYYEHMPLRHYSQFNGDSARIYQRTNIGNLIEFNLLDTRQFRDPPPCRDPRGEVVKYSDLCTEAKSSTRSMLGKAQENWLARGYGQAGARWNSLIQTAPMGPFDFQAGTGSRYKMDGWDGFGATRQKILDYIATREIKNPVAVGGEIHAYYAGVVYENPFDPETRPLMSELITTSITSAGGGDERYQTTKALFRENQGARFFENRYRGYMLCEVNHKLWQTTLRCVDDVNDPLSDSKTLKKLVIENDRVGVKLS